MKVTVTGRHVTVSEPTHAQIGRKLARLDRLLNGSAVSAQCVLGRERGQYMCELTVHARGDHMLHGVGRHARVDSAVTAAVRKVDHQAQKLADRWKSRRRNDRARGSRRTPAARPLAGEPIEPARRIVRSRRYAVKPLTVEDAALALDADSRDFLVFRHASTGALAVLYRRPDGNLGLIEPEA
jgi:putative sigma-54 modulation protein